MLQPPGQLMEGRRHKRPASLELPPPQEERHFVVLEGIAPGAKLALYRLEAQGSLFSTEDNRRFGLLSTWRSMYAFQLGPNQGRACGDGQHTGPGAARGRAGVP